MYVHECIYVCVRVCMHPSVCNAPFNILRCYHSPLGKYMGNTRGFDSSRLRLISNPPASEISSQEYCLEGDLIIRFVQMVGYL